MTEYNKISNVILEDFQKLLIGKNTSLFQYDENNKQLILSVKEENDNGRS